jgi:hypothetical protein
VKHLHSWFAVGWIIIVLEWLTWEVIGITVHHGGIQPFTFYVRKIAGTWTSPMWFLTLGFLVWLIVHFLFIHPHA